MLPQPRQMALSSSTKARFEHRPLRTTKDPSSAGVFLCAHRGRCHRGPQSFECSPETRHALFSDPVAPLALDVRDQSSGRGDLISATIRDHHKGRTPIGRVGLASHVAAPLKGIHEVAHRLIGHLGPLRKDANPCPSAFDVLENGGVRGTQVVEPLGGKSFEELVEEAVPDPPQEHPDVLLAFTGLDRATVLDA